MEAIVLAGGLGTRLRSVVSDVPKPMAPINGIPFLVYILEYLKKNGVDRVILSVGYKWKIIKDYFGERYGGMKLLYSVEDEPLGTGGAIKQALNFGKDEDIFIVNGDTFFDVDFKSLAAEFKSKKADLMLSLKTMFNFDRYGCVETDEEKRVVSFTEKEYRNVGNINGGIYLAKKNLFEGFQLPDKFSFETFMREHLNHLAIYAFVSDGYFIDIGIPEDYKKANIELRDYL